MLGPVRRVRLDYRRGEAMERIEAREQGTSAAEMNKPGVLLEHWRDQYDRLLRAHSTRRRISEQP